MLLTNYKCIRSKWTISLYVDRSNKQNNIPVWNLEQFLDILSWKKIYEVNNTGISDAYKPTTVDKPHLTDTCLILKPHYYGQLALSLGKKALTFTLKFSTPLDGYPVNTDTFYGPLGVCINRV